MLLPPLITEDQLSVLLRSQALVLLDIAAYAMHTLC